MSMRGEIISKEYENMVWVRDKDGKQYACYVRDVKNQEDLTDEEREKCLDISQIAGDNW